MDWNKYPFIEIYLYWFFFFCLDKRKKKMENALQQHLLQATTMMEQQVDAEIEKMEKLDDDDFERLREKRMQNMMKAQKQKQDWVAAGHGKYFEVPGEKEFFAECKKSKKVVCHFYRESTFRCKIMDRHLEILAHKHIETKFIKIDAEKCKFLVEKLRIVVLPTLCIAKDGKTTDYVVGFDDMGGVDDFQTEVLEWRLGGAGALHYDGDLMTPPVAGGKKQSLLGGDRKKTIKGGGADDSSDENDW